jgi:peroxidase
MKSKSLKMDGTFDTDLQHHLFKPDNWHHGVDLFAINIARGREHGIGSYGAVKTFCKNHKIYSKFYKGQHTDSALFNSVAQIKTIRDKYISKPDAAKAGKTQDDFIDLYVGMQLEKHMDGGTVGPTSGCIVAEQFVALKEGDRFWFESFGVFTPEQLGEIRKMTLGAVSCQTFEGTYHVYQGDLKCFISPQIYYPFKLKKNKVTQGYFWTFQVKHDV